MKKVLEKSDAACYTMDAVNETGCPEGETMDRQPNTKMITAAYERLSRDDELQGPSNSIVNQKELLEDYASKNDLHNLVHYTDDGISGTRFDRPGFVSMMDDIEAGKVSTVICKDTSRLGRDYLRVGLFMETLRQKGVRLIALGDNVDTALGEDDFVPFRNIIHEFYARDASRKIKNAYKARGMSGKHTSCHAIYGYMKSPEDKHQWLVDSEAAVIVRRIFDLTIEGYGPYSIASKFEKDRVFSPGYYLAQKGLGNHQSRVFKNPYRWCGSSIIHILEHAEYMGHMVNFKTYKTSFKDTCRKYTTLDQRVVFEDKHEAIIDSETWHLANQIRQKSKRRRPDSLGAPRPMSGLLYCFDCGARMYHQRGTYSWGAVKDYYTCSTYNMHPVDCSGHRINTEPLIELVLDTLRTVSEYAKGNEAEFTQKVNEMFSSQQALSVKTQRKSLASSRKRRDELDRLIQRIYEDNIAGRITDKRFEVLSGEYEREQGDLEQAIAELQIEIDSFDDSADRARKFLSLTKRYTDFSELTSHMIAEFIQKIVVHERAEKNKKFTMQKVEIYLNFIEDFTPPPNAIIEDATAPDPEQAEREKSREYQRDYHRRRRENDGKPLTPEDTRTPDEIAADEAEKKEKNKTYQREYQREYQRKKAHEKREAIADEAEMAAAS